MNNKSAVEFLGSRRIHIALAVTDFDQSLAFYQTLLGAEPVKIRPGYAKFEPRDPSLNLTLNEVQTLEVSGNSTSHYGLQVKSTDAVREAVGRFVEAGLSISLEENTTCCYAVQDKVWVADPDGNQWEVFVVTEADADQRKDPSSACCAQTAGASSCC